MRDYEMMYIIKPDLADEAVAEIKEKLHKIIKDLAVNLKTKFQVGEKSAWRTG